MNILCCAHGYIPTLNAGAEMYMHNINKFLVSKGHSVKVMIKGLQTPYTIDGVHCIGISSNPELAFLLADIVICHLEMTYIAIPIATKLNKPIVHYVHNNFPYPILHDNKHVNLVYNSETIASKCNYLNPSYTLPAPVNAKDFDIRGKLDRKYITLVNLNANKGGKQFHDLARLLPEYEFLGVKGSYEAQIVESLPNVTHWSNGCDMMEVYAKTKILLVLSEYESFSMCAREAACSGIPVICTDTWGIVSNMADSGIYVDREDYAQISTQIKRLMTDKGYYDSWSKKVKKRAQEQCSSNTLPAFEKYLLSLVYKN